MGFFHKRSKWCIIKRLNEFNPFYPFKLFPYGLLYIRIQVYGIDNLNIFVILNKL